MKEISEQPIAAGAILLNNKKRIKGSNSDQIRSTREKNQYFQMKE